MQRCDHAISMPQPRLSSTSAAATQLRPLQPLLLDCAPLVAALQLRPLQLLLYTECIHFSHCSPIASPSSLLRDCVRVQAQLFCKVPAPAQHSRAFFVEFTRFGLVLYSTKVAHHYSLVESPKHPMSITHTQA